MQKSVEINERYWIIESLKSVWKILQFSECNGRHVKWRDKIAISYAIFRC